MGTVTYPNGVSAQYSYDALNRVTGLAASSSAAEVGGYTYQPRAHEQPDQRLGAERPA